MCKKNNSKISEHMFMSSCFLILNGRRDTAANKEFAIVIQMTLEDELVQRFKKKIYGRKK